MRLTKEALGWDPDVSFTVPAEVAAFYAQVAARGRELHREWQERLSAYEREYPDAGRAFAAALAGELPPGWADRLPTFPAGEELATRSASGKALNALAPLIPTLLGGSADLASSNDTTLKDCGDGRDCGVLAPGSYAGRNVWFGVREHAMASALTGMARHGGVIPYGGTFFTFSDYMRPAIRLAALSGAHVVYVWTHDSVGLGEDGPTHQPVEQLASLRAMPGLVVIRPSDANETALAWRVALEHTQGPVGLVLTRQKVPTLDRSRLAPAEGLLRGGYVLKDAVGAAPELVLIGTGSEVSLALEAADIVGGGRTPGARGGSPQLGALRAAGRGLPGRGAAGRREGESGRGGGLALRLGALGGLRRGGGRHRSVRRVRAGAHGAEGTGYHLPARGGGGPARARGPRRQERWSAAGPAVAEGAPHGGSGDERG